MKKIIIHGLFLVSIVFAHLNGSTLSSYTKLLDSAENLQEILDLKLMLDNSAHLTQKEEKQFISRAVVKISKLFPSCKEGIYGLSAEPNLRDRFLDNLKRLSQKALELHLPFIVDILVYRYPKMFNNDRQKAIKFLKMLYKKSFTVNDYTEKHLFITVSQEDQDIDQADSVVSGSSGTVSPSGSIMFHQVPIDVKRPELSHKKSTKITVKPAQVAPEEDELDLADFMRLSDQEKASRRKVPDEETEI